MSDSAVDPSTCDEGVTYEGMNTEEVSYKGSAPVGAEFEGSTGTTIDFTIKKEIGSVKFAGSLNLGVTASAKVYLTFSYQYVEIKLDYSAKLSASLSGKAESSLPLSYICIAPFPGVIIEFTPSIVVETNVKIEMSGTLKGTLGLKASNTEGLQNISTNPSFKPEIKVEGTIFVGISLVPKVKILSDVITGSMTAKLGAEVKATVSKTIADTSKQIHECNNCISGEISAKATLSFEIKFINNDNLKFTFDVANIKIKICDFYFSYDFADFDFTTCPHQKYKVTITVKNSKGETVSGATVNDEYTTDADGKVEFFLNGGKYTITAKSDEFGTGKAQLTVDGKPASVTVVLNNLVSDKDLGGSSGDDYNSGAFNVLSLGENHSAYIDKNGDLYTWGKNSDGRLGDGMTADRYTPTKIMSNVKSVSLGGNHSAAITENGDLYTWGYNIYGQLGDGTTTDKYTPTKIMSNVKSVSLGVDHSAAITEKNDLYTWGLNDVGQLGDGTMTDKYTPAKIMSNVKSVSLGRDHSAAITQNGDLYTWGYNFSGLLGNGTTTERHTPTKITIPSAKTYSKSSNPVSANNGNIQTFTNLMPNETYNFYSMKTMNAENLFGSPNLLYITQCAADENGKLSVTFTPDEDYDKATCFVVPLKQTDLSAAKVTMNNLKYNAKTQYVAPVVTLDGKTLVEGRDYDLCGDYFAKSTGSYTVTVRGRGLYTGEVDFAYKVIPTQIIKGDVDFNGTVNIDDVTLTQKYIANMYDFDSEQLKATDVTGDGNINIDDVTKIQKYIAGLISSLSNA